LESFRWATKHFRVQQNKTGIMELPKKEGLVLIRRLEWWEKIEAKTRLRVALFTSVQKRGGGLIKKNDVRKRKSPKCSSGVLNSDQSVGGRGNVPAAILIFLQPK
jgi:hypothetical protein